MQRSYKGNGRSLAQVVGIGLEGETEHRNSFSPKRTAASCGDFTRHRPFAQVIAGNHRLDDAQWDFVIVCSLQQSPRVFRKTRATEAWPGVQKLCSDPVVEPHAAGHVLNIGAQLLGQIGDLIDERDLGGEEGIRCVFDELGAAAAGVKNGARLR